MEYPIPAAAITIELDIKNSQFIGYAAPAATPELAQEIVNARKALHPKANHNCWAFVAGAPGEGAHRGCSDDGEPKGTAGQPMLKVLDHCDIGQLCVVVTRYFGGIKLGTGGLVRAYSQTTVEAVKALSLTQFIPQCELTLQCPYTLTGQIEHILSQVGARVVEREWSDLATLTIEVAEQNAQQLKHLIQPWPEIIINTPDA